MDKIKSSLEERVNSLELWVPELRDRLSNLEGSSSRINFENGDSHWFLTITDKISERLEDIKRNLKCIEDKLYDLESKHNNLYNQVFKISDYIIGKLIKLKNKIKELKR